MKPSFQPSTLWHLALWAVLALAAQSCGAPADTGDDAQLSGERADGVSTMPSPPITSITWDASSWSQAAPGSDLWSNTWAGDGNVYTAWGDGGGFNGTNSLGRVSFGVARLSGTPPNYAPTNVLGGYNGLYAPTFGGKIGSLLAVNGTLYANICYWPTTGKWGCPTPDDNRIAYSTDYSKTWKVATWTFQSMGFDWDGRFINFGKDYQGAKDNYVYMFVPAANLQYLLRVPKDQILTKASYQVLSGFDASGNPTWSSNMSQKHALSVGGEVVYNAPLGRFVHFQNTGQCGAFDVMESLNPWGPWHTIVHYDNWMNANGGPGDEPLGYHISNKWLSADGKTFWMTFSCYNGTNPNEKFHDRFNVIKGTFVLGSSTPSPVANWHLDEGSGTTTADASGSGNVGTLVNGPTWTSSGHSGAALSFNGANKQYVDFGNPADLHITGSMTVSAWFKLSALAAFDMPVVSKRGATPNRGWQLYVDPDGGIAFDVGISSSTYAARYSSVTAAAGTWYHVVGVYDAPAKTLDIYVNGQLKNGGLTAAVPAAQFDPPIHVNVGRSAGANPGQVFSGTIDEVRVYDAALAASAVQAIP